MLHSVFLRTIRDWRMAVLWIIVGTLAYVMFMDSLWPYVKNSSPFLEQILADFGSNTLFSMLGVRGDELTSAGGFLTARSYGWLVPVAFSVFAAGNGAAAIAGEEERNTIDLLMANPISRHRLVLEKFAAMVVLLTIVAAGLFGSVLIGEAIWDLGIPTDRYLAATFQALLLGLAFGGIAFAAGALGARRGLIVGIVSVVIVFSFLLYTLGDIFEWLDAVRRISPFYYYAENRPLFEGIDWVNAGVLAGISVVALIVSVIGFRRRDLAV